MSLSVVKIQVFFCFFVSVLSTFIFLNPAFSGRENGSFPASLIMPGGDGNAILVEKDSQTLFVYESREGRFYRSLEFVCSTGEVTGPKYFDGDKKTPEGIYFLEHEYEDRYLTPIYGKKAFTTDYPNFFDKKAGRNGSAIWIHGTNKQLKPRDSNGCITMNNKDILELEQYIVLNETPVVIVGKIEYVDTDELDSEHGKIDRLVSRWIDAMDKGEYHEFLSFYSAEPLPDMGWWGDWCRFRESLKEKDEGISLSYDFAGIFRNKDYFVVFVEIKVCSIGNCIPIGRKKLFITGKMMDCRIVGDFFHTPDSSMQEWKYSLSFAADQFVEKNNGHAIPEMIDNWLHAWSSGDMVAYAGFYDENFYSDGMNRKQWVVRKSRLAAQYDYIRVTGTDFNIRTDENTRVVTFFQDYRSSNFNVKGLKTLVLVQEGEQWKIYREKWRKR